MEAILTVAVMAVIVVGIFMTVKSDASPSHKAMLMLIIFVVGVPGGSIAVALAQISPVWGFVAVALVVAFASAILPGLYEGATGKNPFASKGFERSNRGVKVSKEAEETVLKKLGGIKAGEKVTFGRYDRVVMDTKENEALLMTDKIVLYRKYDGKNRKAVWENCELREYPGGKFFDEQLRRGRKGSHTGKKPHKSRRRHGRQGVSSEPQRGREIQGLYAVSHSRRV